MIKNKLIAFLNSKLIPKFTTQEVLTICLLSVSIGVLFWGWTYVYYFFKPFLKGLGLSYLTAGFWILTGIFMPAIIQKPWVAIISSCIAALVEGIASSWGVSAVLYGFIQGLGAEIIFFIFRYRSFGKGPLFLATLSSVSLSFFYDFYLKQYWILGLRPNILLLSSFYLSGILLAYFPTLFFLSRLLKTGLLNQFLIVSRKK